MLINQNRNQQDLEGYKLERKGAAGNRQHRATMSMKDLGYTGLGHT